VRAVFMSDPLHSVFAAALASLLPQACRSFRRRQSLAKPQATA
jgi:hypothetical protein